MKLPLSPDGVDSFERQIDDFGPWMHAYHLGDDIYTGYYKSQGLPRSLTWVTRSSATADIERMREAYNRRRHDLWTEYVQSIFDRVCDKDCRSSLHLLDIGSASGLLSFRAVQDGFGRVTSSEIRPEQCAQQRLLLDTLSNSKYRQRIAVVHDPVSADDPSFPERYLVDQPDIVCSFGLLYHLVNPFQHLVNLHRIAGRAAVVYSMTHYHPFAKGFWALGIEDAEWITKSTSSISWTPHFLEVARLCRVVGFRRVTVVYPQLFMRNFPEMVSGRSRWVDVKLAAAMALQRLTGVRIGHMRNFEPDYFRDSTMNPNYAAYVCEK